jgi:hypothetical protein
MQPLEPNITIKKQSNYLSCIPLTVFSRSLVNKAWRVLRTWICQIKVVDLNMSYRYCYVLNIFFSVRPEAFEKRDESFS